MFNYTERIEHRHVKSIDLWHHHIQDDEIRLGHSHHVESRFSIRRLLNLVARISELLSQQRTYWCVIVNDKDGWFFLDITQGGMLDLLLQAL